MTRIPYALSERLRALLWWLPLWLVIALIAVFMTPPIPMHSTRTLAVAWDMWLHHQFWVPHINGAPYPQKTPLLFWLIHAGWAVSGVNDVWPRVLEVLIGAAQLILAQALARRLFPDRPWVARATPWMLGTFGFAFLFGLQIMYDGLLTVWVLAALLCLVPTSRHPSPRWIAFAVCVGLGLLTKGPVMLLHVAPAWLLGVWWSDYARRERVRWYGFGILALIGGCVILVAWALPAARFGGAEYANNLLFHQTAGRVVDAFVHARPWWWYLPRIPVLLFPFVLWPRMWAGLASLRAPLAPGLRFALAWLVPAFVVFSVFSGKQTYYLIPELPAVALVMAAAVANLRARGGAASRSAWLDAWPLTVVAFVLAVLLFALPPLVAAGKLQNHWLRDLAIHSASFGVLCVLLGGLMLIRGRGELRRIAIASLIGSAAAYALFAVTLSPAFNLLSVSKLIATAEAHGRTIGNLDIYQGQFDFLGRLTKPVDRLYEGGILQDWVARHPRGMVVSYPDRLSPDILRYARFVQPYRGQWLVVWDAPVLAMLRRGRQPPEPPTQTVLYPAPDYWRYREVR